VLQNPVATVREYSKSVAKPSSYSQRVFRNIVKQGIIKYRGSRFLKRSYKKGI
jgi:hypothetical protein